MPVPQTRITKMRQRDSLTTADLVVLSLLSERPMHGYDLIQEYKRQEVKDWALVSRPHVYYALRKLEELRLIEATKESNGKHERTVFHVSNSGHSALADALADEGWATNMPPAPFTTWLGLSIHAKPNDILKIFEKRRSFLISEIIRENLTLTEIQKDSNRRARIGEAMVNLVIQQYENELRWLDGFVIERIYE